MGNNKFGQLSEQSSYDSGNGLPEQTLVHITSREVAHFYMKSFSKFNINQSWLCKNYSFFRLIWQSSTLTLREIP